MKRIYSLETSDPEDIHELDYMKDKVVISIIVSSYDPMHDFGRLKAKHYRVFYTEK